MTRRTVLAATVGRQQTRESEFFKFCRAMGVKLEPWQVEAASEMLRKPRRRSFLNAPVCNNA